MTSIELPSSCFLQSNLTSFKSYVSAIIVQRTWANYSSGLVINNFKWINVIRYNLLRREKLMIEGNSLTWDNADILYKHWLTGSTQLPSSWSTSSKRLNKTRGARSVGSSKISTSSSLLTISQINFWESGSMVTGKYGQAPKRTHRPDRNIMIIKQCHRRVLYSKMKT